MNSTALTSKHSCLVQNLPISLSTYLLSLNSPRDKLPLIIPTLHVSHWQIPNKFSAKIARNSHVVPSLQYDESLESCRVCCPSPATYGVTCQTICGSADCFFNESWKLDADVYFTNSLNHWPQRHCDNKTYIETPREQSVVVTSQLPATGSCVDDVTIVSILKSSGAVTG